MDAGKDTDRQHGGGEGVTSYRTRHGMTWIQIPNIA